LLGAPFEALDDDLLDVHGEFVAAWRQRLQKYQPARGDEAHATEVSR
jgi:hypothetical protein